VIRDGCAEAGSALEERTEMRKAIRQQCRTPVFGDAADGRAFQQLKEPGSTVTL